MGGILVHEWLEASGGSENVFEAISEMHPEAERWCLWNNSRGRFTDVSETMLARSALRRNKALALPLMPIVWRKLPNRSADWVLISSHLFAHHARFNDSLGPIPKLVYAHTPARYIWEPGLDRRGESFAAQAASLPLKRLDRERAQEPIAIAANSRYVAERIARCWDRDASVIYPPVPVQRYEQPDPSRLTERDLDVLNDLPEGFVLGASRFVKYKRLDAALTAGKIAGMPTVLAGSGPDRDRLRHVSDDLRQETYFVDSPSNALLAELYRRAACLVFASIEDFGIMPIECMAAGTPVIASAEGGTSESVVDGITGVLMENWNDRSELRRSVEQAIKCSPVACQERARLFDTDRFTQELSSFIALHLSGTSS